MGLGASEEHGTAIALAVGAAVHGLGAPAGNTWRQWAL